jgi:hypothetical protein
MHASIRLSDARSAELLGIAIRSTEVALELCLKEQVSFS